MSTRPTRSIFVRQKLRGGKLAKRRGRQYSTLAATRRQSLGRAAMLPLIVALVLVVAMGIAHATTSTDTTFEAASQRLSDWTSGTLGSVLRMGVFLVGMAMGIVTQRIVVPLFSTLAIYFAPSVVDTIFGALI